MDVSTFDILLRLVIGIIFIPIAVLGGSVLVYAFVVSINDLIKKHKNRKNPNLHITIDKKWKK